MQRMLLVMSCVCLLLLTSCSKDAKSAATSDRGDPIDSSVFDGRVEVGNTNTLDAEIQAAIAEREPKQIWCEEFFTSTREEARLFRFTNLDCIELYKELLDSLFPGATITKQKKTIEGVQLEMTLDRVTITCTSTPQYINIRGISAVKDIMDSAADWLKAKTGMEVCEWTGYDKTRISANKIYVSCADGIPIGATAYGMMKSFGLWGENTGIVVFSPIALGEDVRTVQLNNRFSPEEFRMAAELNFIKDMPIIEVYQSCELSYLIHEERGMLVPVWWVKGTRYNYESGGKTDFEMVFDAETGSLFDFGGA